MWHYSFESDLRKPQPSQEGFGTILGVAFLAWLGYMSISGLISLIKEKYKSLEAKIEEKISYLIDSGYGDFSVDKNIINGNDFPRADWTDAKDGKHWEIDQNLRKEVMENESEFTKQNDPLIVYDCVKFEAYLNFLKGFDSLVTFLTTAQINPDLAKKVDEQMKALERLGVKFETSKEVKLKSVDLPRENITWPNHPVFKQPQSIVNQISTFSKNSSKKLDILAKKVRETIAAPTDGKSKEELGSQVVFLRAVSLMLDLLEKIPELFSLYDFTLNNDTVFGSCLVLKNKAGKDITSRH